MEQEAEREMSQLLEETKVALNKESPQKYHNMSLETANQRLKALATRL